MRTSRTLALFGPALLVLLLAGCPPEDHVCLYCTEAVAPSWDEASVRALDHLGATLVDQGVNFSVFAGNADRVDLLLFDDPEASRPTRQFQMERMGDAWNLYVEGVGEGQYYGFIAWGPNWPVHPDWFPGSIHGFVSDVDALGNRYNPNKLLLDPYARMAHRDHDWGKGSLASGPARTQSTFAAAAKSIVTKSHYTWSEDEARWRENRKNPDWAGHRWQDLVMYEVHPKGLTADPASEQWGVTEPGTFRGFGEMADYLADLGINAVELMPVMEKPLDGGYWGYNNLLFFAPEVSFVASARPSEGPDEFKWMVDQLHQRGIEVILDVVYNHTGEGGLWREKMEMTGMDLDPATTGSEMVNLEPKEVAGLYNFRGLDNASYYLLDQSDPGFYNNATGVGNTARANYRPMRRLILDSLHYWVEEMHVDGFRFDLAVILGDKDKTNGWEDVTQTVLQEIVDDPVLQANNVRVIAEPWAMTGFHLGNFPKAQSPGDGSVAYYEWNGNFRDFWRSYLNWDDWSDNRSEGAVDLGGSLTGSQNLFGDDGRRPYHSVNFLTVHDGFTLYDLFTYPEKQNGCGPLNPICCPVGTSSPFCDRNTGEDNNRSRDWGDEGMKRQMVRNAFAAMLLSQGTPLILGGDEWMRTQLGNNNAYTSWADNEYNWYQWGTYTASKERTRMHDFVRQLVHFRRNHAYAFARASYDAGAPFSWKDVSGGDSPDWSSRHMAMHFWDASQGPELLILINMELGQVDFALPGGRTWRRVLDTQAWFDSDAFFTESGADDSRSSNITLDAPEAIPGGTYGVPSRTIVVLEATD